MAKQILCRRCGTHIKTIGDGETYQDAYLPAFSQLCNECRGNVGEEFERRTAKLRREMDRQGYSTGEQENELERLRRSASSRTLVDKIEREVCSQCGGERHLEPMGWRGKLCPSCRRAVEIEEEEITRHRREVARARGDTDVDDL